MRSGRRGGRWRAPLGVGLLGLVLGAACWAPLSPTVLGPLLRAEPARGGEQAAGPGAGVLQPPSTVRAAPLAPTPRVTTRATTVVPTATVLPTPTANGAQLLASVQSDRTAHWVKNHSETALRSGPSDDSVFFTLIPQWSTLKQIDSQPNWLKVLYAGDGATRQPGPGWVKVSDVGAIDAPSVWLSSARQATIWTKADASAVPALEVPPSTMLEVVGSDPIRGTRIQVRTPGDGRRVPPAEGWMDGDALARMSTPAAIALPRGYPDDLRADVRINVPYRTQLDGTAYAGANCGPTALGMALESIGINPAAADLRKEVLLREAMDEQDDDAGSFIWALAQVAASNGAAVRGLYESDNTTLHRWTVDEIRDNVRQGRPVIAQVVYRGLPGREDSDYYGDHYVVVTGLVGPSFLYNDPIGGPSAREAPGYDRIMTPTQLERAMRASDAVYASTAFSIARK